MLQSYLSQDSGAGPVPGLCFTDVKVFFMTYDMHLLKTQTEQKVKN